ncbi:RES domain-containing protein [Photorhabdus khanii subsp. guanajuatensis]|uniref:RES domain-containing protein n=2 Tax=Photorhabdus khanii TaxID=1004150 RepID=A0A4R4JIS0_9GAMM|nr:RES domain-containing protein [Photorhabdus khanii subsp. guanajuatensis]
MRHFLLFSLILVMAQGGKATGTLYGAGDFGTAAMETLFHDVGSPSEGLPFDYESLNQKVYSVIEPVTDLVLVELSARTLRRWGFTKSQVIDSTADKYPFTQRLAAKIHNQHFEAQGLQWSSKQDDGIAVMLFEDRVNKNSLSVIIESKSVSESESAMEDIETIIDDLAMVPINIGGGDPDD